MKTYWLQLEPTRPTVPPGHVRRLSWRVIDERGTAVATGCRAYASYGAAIDDARSALKQLCGRTDRALPSPVDA